MTQKLWLRINFVLNLVLFMLVLVYHSASAKGRSEKELSIFQNATFKQLVLSGPIPEFGDKLRINIRQTAFGHQREKSVGCVQNKTFVIGYLTGSDLHSTDRHYMRPGLQISGAITLAVKEINEQRPLVDGHKLEFVVAETYGQELESIMQTAQLWLKNISAYIGPQETCVYEAKMAAAFQLPMLSYFCTNSETSDKKKFPTFARTRPPDTQISKSVASVLKKFHWQKVIFLYNNSPEEDFARVAETIQATLLLHNITVLATKVWNATYFHLYMENIFYAMLKDTFNHCRIYVALGYYYEFLGIMSTMEEQGLFSKGEYFVIGVMLQEYNRMKPEQYLQDFLNEATNITLQNAYQNFLGVIPTAPVGLEKFHEKVDYYLGLPPFNYPNAVESLGGIKRIRPEASYLYDAVNLYAKSLNETLQLGGDPCNGSEIIRRLLGTTYFSSRGYMVHMNMHGDAEGNYTLLSRFPLKSRSSDFGLYPVGDFRYSIEYFGLPELHLTKAINWKKGDPPIDEPPCGFGGEKCFYQKTEIIVGVAGGLALLILIFLVMAYRNWKYEQELDSLLWKINFKDVQGYQPPHKNIQIQSKERVGRGAFCLRSSQLSLNSNIWPDPRGTSTSTQLGIYKGRVVAMKHFPIKAVEITRKVKKELKMMRDLRHDNIVGFVGACVDSPNICFLSEYCTRGSLKDILENGDVRLDAMFIASLTRDILQGMIFLHDSQIKFHGCLTTTCCLVDSRWVAKIADYGLNSLRGFFEANPLENVNETEVSYDLLYRAPELLRDRSIRGTQKGDVFSFAIILYELHARNGPYVALDLPPSAIVDKVKLGPLKAQEPFRPPVSSLDNCLECVRNCLAECWAENPDDRPEFRSIRQKLLPLRKGMKPNIFDNMLDIMEKYANNLEALVEERTDLLKEEKKKTDALLYEMLPRVVAEQLKKGHRVEAENFDCVTIFFSDIVGFTEMSAQSTALQVVDFLNDLYTCFDSIIGYYDVYKVETIGDAYMVVSGLPLRNGDDHAGEIGSMSFHLLQSISTFHIRHLPGHMVKLRIGVHSGPVCAGVVGVKMPRYCLFGDTVNTASRMESLGSPLKIHCSSAFRDILTSLGGYTFEERGRIKVKGKGEMTTYWLIANNNPFSIAKNIQLSYNALLTVHYAVNQVLGKEAAGKRCRESPSNRRRCAEENQLSTRHRNGLQGSIKSMSSYHKNDPSPNGQRRLRFVKSDGILPQCSKQYTSTSKSITLIQSTHEDKNAFSSLKGGSFQKAPSDSPDLSPEYPFMTNSESELDSEYEPEYQLVVEGKSLTTNPFTPSTETLNQIDSDNSFGHGYTTTIKMFSRETQPSRKDWDRVRSTPCPPKGNVQDKWCHAQNISSRDLGENIESPWCDSPARSNCSKILSEIGKSVKGIYEESSPLLTQVTNYNVIKETTLNQDTQL